MKNARQSAIKFGFRHLENAAHGIREADEF
jgi:hypothetical protein